MYRLLILFLIVFFGIGILYLFSMLTPVTTLLMISLVLFGFVLFLSFSTQKPKDKEESSKKDYRYKQQSFSHSVIPFSSVFEHHIDPILLVNHSGRIEQANHAAHSLLGEDIEEHLLSSILRHPEVLETMSKAYENEKSSIVNFTRFMPYEVYMKAIIIPFIVSDNHVRKSDYVMLILRDETSIRRTDRMRSDFLANASHELRTPLASLSGFIETLKGHAKEDVEARGKFLDIMSLQAERMRRLIDDLLSLSRIELNEHILPTKTVDLVNIVNDIKDSLNPILQQSQQRINVISEQKPYYVRGDYDQLLEVVQNLVENALKYSKKGEKIRITLESGCSLQAIAHHNGYQEALSSLETDNDIQQITVFSEEKKEEKKTDKLSDNSVRINLLSPPQFSLASEQEKVQSCYTILKVRDWGDGIDRHYLPRLAERFYRVEGQDQKEHSGTGLGLAIVKHIISRHRGGLSVESEVKKGSEFSVLLLEKKEES